MGPPTSTGDPRFDVDVTYDVRVPLPDGVRLAGNLYRPVGPDAPASCPAILTLIPYHKDGRGGFGSLEPYHEHFAARGYAVLHLDLRGTGSSDGVPFRAMDGRERIDGHHAVEWAAAQPWCSGEVGAWGISYGGITAMAIAESRPPHLRAIVPVHAPDDNYEAMVVHRGARLMFWPDPHWGAGMVASNLMPPLRADPAGDWLRVWQERLDVPPWILDWYGPPPEPDQWQRQQVDASQIEVPTFAICGWQDAYPDSVHSLWSQLAGPKRLLYGPWKHILPERAGRAPVDTLAEIDRWWDRWLKGIENGVDREPPVTIFVQGVDEWRHEGEWPPARAAERSLFPAAGGRLTDLPTGAAASDTYDYDARVGLHALAEDACTGPIRYPADQSADDYRSLIYTTDPLHADLEVTGVASVRLVVSAEIPIDQLVLVAKLCDVAPDGRSLLVAFDHLPGARATPVADSAEDGRWCAEFALRPTSHVFRAGHRIRLSVSGGNFPYLWPTPRPYRLHLHIGAPGAALLTLPVTPPQNPPLPRPQLGPPPNLIPKRRLAGIERYTTHVEETARVVSFEGLRTHTIEVEPGSTLSISQHFVMAVDADHPAHANTRTTTHWRLERSVNAVEVRAQTLTTLHDVHVAAEVDLDGHPYLRRGWRKTR